MSQPPSLSLSLSLSLVHVCCYPVSSSPFRVFETVTSEDRVSGSSSCTRARYRHSFVYLKFPANPRESGSPRKRHATTYSPDRRTNVRPSRCVGSCMDNFITCIEAMLVCAYVCVCIYIYIYIYIYRVRWCGEGGARGLVGARLAECGGGVCTAKLHY